MQLQLEQDLEALGAGLVRGIKDASSTAAGNLMIIKPPQPLQMSSCRCGHGAVLGKTFKLLVNRPGFRRRLQMAVKRNKPDAHLSLAL